MSIKMVDVQSVKTENENMRKIRGNFLQWEVKDCLAQLSEKQQEVVGILHQAVDQHKIFVISSEKNGEQRSVNAKKTYLDNPSTLSIKHIQINQNLIENTIDFFFWCKVVDVDTFRFLDAVYLNYYKQLIECNKRSDIILNLTEKSLNRLNKLQKEYDFVSNKTQSLNFASEKSIEDQRLVNKINSDIHQRLHYFFNAEYLLNRLQSPTLSVSSEQFTECLDEIDKALNYLQINSIFKEAHVYINRYKQAINRANFLIRNYVIAIINSATEQILTSLQDRPTGMNNAVFALYYGKYQASAIKVKRISTMIEDRIMCNIEYEHLLGELHSQYLSERGNIMRPAVNKSVQDLKSSNKGDYCVLVRSACAFVAHICKDEYRLFSQFFTVPCSKLDEYLQGLCTVLYDTLRPCIIHISHIETLAEICNILRLELIEEYIQQNGEALKSFGEIISQLLQDVQERLVFRAHIYLQTEILNYNPSPGDLAYPDKLEMMEKIALSLQTLPRTNSTLSEGSTASNFKEDAESIVEVQSYRSASSPADLHGMWYPAVRRTLVCLSRIYRCVDRAVFQGLSQEALKCCIQSIIKAAIQITANKTSIDGELFEMKHLLILREQIAPFRVDFTVRETSLDFSKVKTAAFGLLHKRKQLFSLNANNALLEFLLDGTPQVKEHMLDSRKEVDLQLKRVCEKFIEDGANLFIGLILEFLDKAQEIIKRKMEQNQTNFCLKQIPWASCQEINKLIQNSQRSIKINLPNLQRSMQLYLSNKDTEFIVFRPIRNNIIGAFVKLEQILTTNGYNTSDMTIINCPPAETVSVLISSASILASTTGKNQ